MKRAFIIFLTFASSLARAELFVIAGTPQRFDRKDGLLIARCEKDCEALRTIRKYPKINLKEARKGMAFVNSTGSDVCSRVYMADSLLGQAENRDRRAFCLFKDGSIVEMNSLSTYLEKRKIVR